VQLRRTAQMSWNRGPTALNTSRHHTAGFDEELDLPTPSSELDMDVIIQSFMHDQPSAFNTIQYPIAPNQQMPPNQWTQTSMGAAGMSGRPCCCP